jgi:hypothetical protein
MKRIVMISLMLVLVVALIAAPVMAGKPSDCTRIQDGVLTYSAGHYLEGEPLTIGYDIFGYNYQAHLFVGSYANVYLGRDGYPPYCGDDEAYDQKLIDESFTSDPYGKWYWPYRDVWLNMKWNDAWLSNKDCDNDGALDRHLGFDSYIGSGAWETNHMRGEDEGQKWVYFTKIVAVPADATLLSGKWYAVDGTEIGPVIWGEFATIQEVESGLGATYVSPSGPGFGKW